MYWQCICVCRIMWQYTWDYANSIYVHTCALPCVCMWDGHRPLCAMCAHLFTYMCVCLKPLLMSVYIHVQVLFRVSKPVLIHVGLERAACALPLPHHRHTPQTPTAAPLTAQEVRGGTRPSVPAEEVPRCITDTGRACPQPHLSTHTHTCAHHGTRTCTHMHAPIHMHIVMYRALTHMCTHTCMLPIIEWAGGKKGDS